MNTTDDSSIDACDRRLIVATQAGLPLVPRPYALVAAAVGASEGEVIERLRLLLQRGVIRRIGAVPNHFALGYRANGMSVWDVDDAHVDRLGERIGALDCVSHCYRRPRRLPSWPYNLFAMVHGRNRAEVEGEVDAIAKLLGSAARGHAVLYSRRILKKTGMRLAARAADPRG
uniref:siroheme decarboxylase n=1 Tax=uncultured bacterium 888 TaxID=548896 RepID=B8R8P7_9BACT|nr:putative heme D1 biosynthesis protein NirH [uncultured bacterium 888]